MIKIGINGFGRIGRAIFRINLKHKLYKIVAINDIDPDINNHAYLLKNDSIYGKLNDWNITTNDTHLILQGRRIQMYTKKDISEVPWQKHDIDIVVDSSGVSKNVLNSRNILGTSVKKVIITHSPRHGIDFTFIRGVNEDLYNKRDHNIISCSICDVNAVAPFYKIMNDNFGIRFGTITTLHPWLSYQNLLDGTLSSVSSPGHFWKDYALGRSSAGNMIPKQTTLVAALSDVIPSASKALSAMSFRTPTSIVSIADGTFLLRKKTSKNEIVKVLQAYIKKYDNVLWLNDESLVSIDFLANENAAVVDNRWLTLNNGIMLHFILWYDNEWGYSKRVYDIIRYLQ